MPLLGAFVGILFWRWSIGRRLERAPVADKLLRPAGESLRLEIEGCSERLGTQLVSAVAFPAVALASIIVGSPDGNVTIVRASVGFTACTILLLALVPRDLKTGSKLRNLKLGFQGERAVAEELNQLSRQGCHVFHDVPMAPYSNLDHVIVSSAGVFAVETKTRRKRKTESGQAEYKVVFDGKTLQFPLHSETKPLDQARRQSDQLSAVLSKSVGESVSVTPILTLPGWFVVNKVKSDLKVIPPKAIARYIGSIQPPHLSNQLVGRILHQLDQKCRNVEF